EFVCLRDTALAPERGDEVAARPRILRTQLQDAPQLGYPLRQLIGGQVKVGERVVERRISRARLQSPLCRLKSARVGIHLSECLEESSAFFGAPLPEIDTPQVP